MASKLGRRTDQRMAMLKNQVTDLFWYGKIETTLQRAKSVSAMTEKLLTLAINTYNDTTKGAAKEIKNEKGETVTTQFVIDGPKKLNARRKLMANLYDIQETKNEGENKSSYRARIKDIKHPLIEKIFNEYAPKYAKRAEEKGQGGGYTRILKLGKRRGDDAEMVIIEFVD